MKLSPKFALFLFIVAAAFSGDVEVFGQSKTKIPGASSQKNLNRLHEAVTGGNFEDVKDLLGKGLISVSDINKSFDKGRTLLHFAAMNGTSNICMQLIKSGAEVNAVDSYGDTPLHCACEKGNLSCVPLLALKGADKNIQNGEGKTPLHIAVENNNPEVVEALLRMGVSTDLVDTAGKRADEYADNSELQQCFFKTKDKSKDSPDEELEQLCGRYLADRRLFPSDKEEIEKIISDPAISSTEKRKSITAIIVKRGIASDPNLKSHKKFEDEEEGEIDPEYRWDQVKDDYRLQDSDIKEIETVLGNPDNSRRKKRKVLNAILFLRGIITETSEDLDEAERKGKYSGDPDYLWKTVKEDVRLYSSDKEEIAKILNNLEFSNSKKWKKISEILSKRKIEH